MKEAQTLSRKQNPRISLRFEELLDRAITAAQKYSGSIWTDYNPHDPGVTMLEYLCYALTDLAYRTDFEMKDLLLSGTDHFPLSRLDLFPGQSEILPSAPVLEEDFRRLLTDQIPEISQVWVNAVREDPSGFRGLYDVVVQSHDELTEEQKTLITDQVLLLFHQHRNLCQDVRRVIILQEEIITISAEIAIDSDSMAEQVMATVLHKLDISLNPEITQEDPNELLAGGMNPSDVFDGPAPVYGYIPPGSLAPKVDAIYLSKVRDLIQRVEGVQRLSGLVILRNGVRTHDEIIQFDEETFPKLGGVEVHLAQEQFPLTFLKDGLHYDMDPVSAGQLFDALAASKRSSYQKRVEYDETPPRGLFSERQIRTFYSIQPEMPDLYGLKKHSLPGPVSPRRQAQVNQLRAWLAIFDQLMANSLAQLSNVRRILSISPDLRQTYFTQVPHDIPELETIIKAPDLKTYEELLNQMGETPDEFFRRRHRILDHLMARFGERFPTDALEKFERIRLDFDQSAIQESLIGSKIRFLEHITELTRDRGLGYKQMQVHWDTDNLSGMERRLMYQLNIRQIERRSLVQPLLDASRISRNDESLKRWSREEVITTDQQPVSLWMLPAADYGENELHFYAAGTIPPLQQLFLSAPQRRNYRIITAEASQSEDDRHVLILFTASGAEVPALIGRTHSRDEAEALIDKAVAKYRELNDACEGFFLIEHILLRPLEQITWKVRIFDQKGETYMSSFSASDLDTQKRLADDLLYLAESRDNYQAVLLKDGLVYEVVLYDTTDRPVGKLAGTFADREEADRAVKRAARYFTKIRKDGLDRDEFLEIEQLSGKRNEFPSAFNFSDECTLIVPDWPARFQNEDFMRLLSSLIGEHLPVHLKMNIVGLPAEDMIHFEQIFQEWLAEKAQIAPNFHQLDSLSLQLVQLLMRQQPLTIDSL
jgi:hypothetical protein